MASCPRKYHDNEDCHGVIEHNLLKSAYDIHHPTNYFVPSDKKKPFKLFESEKNDSKYIENNISTQHSIDGSNSDINPRDDYYKNSYNNESYNLQRQPSTTVSQVQIKLNNLINNHKVLLKLYDDIVNLFNEYISSLIFD
jgi:hypothetical protein